MAIKRKREEENPNQIKLTTFGVCTRARSMALKRSMLSHPSPSISISDEVGDACYLHLRSRRLERHPSLLLRKPVKKKCVHAKNSFDLDEKENEGFIKIDEKHKNEGKIVLGDNERENGMRENQEKGFKSDETNKDKANDDFEEKVEDSLGENDLDFDKMEREGTPSSLIVSKDQIKTPTSSNKAITNATIMKKIEIRSPLMPSVQDLEEFFSNAERDRTHVFIDKYNFDLVEEKPFDGRFEWEKVKP